MGTQPSLSVGTRVLLVSALLLFVCSAQPVPAGPPPAMPGKTLVEHEVVDPAVGLIMNKKTGHPMTRMECALPGCGISWKDWEERNPFPVEKAKLRGNPSALQNPEPRTDFGSYDDTPERDAAKENLDGASENETGTKAAGPGENSSDQRPTTQSANVEMAAMDGASQAAMSSMETDYKDVKKQIGAGVTNPESPQVKPSAADAASDAAGVAEGGGDGAAKSTAAEEADASQRQQAAAAQQQAEDQGDAQAAAGLGLLQVGEHGEPDVADALQELDQFDKLDSHISNDLQDFPSDGPTGAQQAPQDDEGLPTMDMGEMPEGMDEGSALPQQGSPGLALAVPGDMGNLDSDPAMTPLVGVSDDISPSQVDSAMALSEAAPAAAPAPAAGTTPAPAGSAAPSITQKGITVSFSGQTQPPGLDVKVGQHNEKTPLVSIGIGVPAHPPPGHQSPPPGHQSPPPKPPTVDDHKGHQSSATGKTGSAMDGQSAYPFPYPGDGLPPLRLPAKPVKPSKAPMKKQCHPVHGCRPGFLPATVSGMTGSAKVLLLPRPDGMPYGAPPVGSVPGEKIPADIGFKTNNYRRPFTSKSLEDEGIDDIAVSSKEEYQRLDDVASGKMQQPFSGKTDEWANEHEMFTNIDADKNCFDYCKVACKPSVEKCVQNNCHRICVEGPKSRVNRMLVNHGIMAPTSQLTQGDSYQVSKLMSKLPRFNEQVSLKSIPARLTNNVMKKLEARLNYRERMARQAMDRLVKKKNVSPDELRKLVDKRDELQELRGELDRMRRAAVAQSRRGVVGRHHTGVRLVHSMKRRWHGRRQHQGGRRARNRDINLMEESSQDAGEGEGDVDIDDKALNDMVADGQSAYKKAMEQAANVMNASNGGPLAGALAKMRGSKVKHSGPARHTIRGANGDANMEEFNLPDVDGEAEQAHLEHKWNLRTQSMDSCPNGCSGTHGVCVRGVCQCKTGWYGNDCSQSKDEHAAVQSEVKETERCPKACNGRGTCLPSNKCLCEEGRFGDACQFDHNPSAKEVAKDKGEDPAEAKANKGKESPADSTKQAAPAVSTSEKIVSVDIPGQDDKPARNIILAPPKTIFQENNAADPPPVLSGKDTTTTPAPKSIAPASQPTNDGTAPTQTLADYPDAGPIAVAVDKGLSDSDKVLNAREKKEQVIINSNVPVSEKKNCYVLCLPEGDVSDCKRMCVGENTQFPQEIEE